MNKVLKSGFWYVVSNLLLGSINFLTTPIFTRALSQNEFGLYSNFASVFSILSSVITLNMHAALIRGHFDFKDDMNKFVSNLIRVSMFFPVIGLLTAFPLREIYSDYLKLDVFMVYCLYGGLLFYGTFNIFQSLQRFSYKYKMNVLLSVLNSVGNIGLSLLFIFTFSNRLHGRVLGSHLSVMLVGGIIAIYYINLDKSISIDYVKYSLKVCLPYIPHLLALTLLSSIDKIMITSIVGPDENAIYSIAVTCGLILTAVCSAINGAFAPWQGEKLKEKDYRVIRKISYPYLGMFALISILICLVSPEIVMILGGKTYAEAIYIIPPIIMGVLCQMIYGVFVNVEQFENRTVPMAIASVISALINIVLNYVFIKLFGYIAAAYTTYISYLFLLIFHVFIVKNMGFGKLFNLRYVTVLVTGATMFAILCNFIYKSMIIRISFFVFILFLGVCFYKKLNRHFGFTIKSFIKGKS